MPGFKVEKIEAQHAVVIRSEVAMQELSEVFRRGFRDTWQVANAQGLAVIGPPFGFYPRMPTDSVEVVVGFPVAAPVTPDGAVTAFLLPGGRVATGTHVGPYDTLAQTYGELAEWAAAEGLTLAEHMWESYLSDPEEEPDPSAWQTLVRWPLA